MRTMREPFIESGFAVSKSVWFGLVGGLRVGLGGGKGTGRSKRKYKSL